jgi:hypothetical protein
MGPPLWRFFYFSHFFSSFSIDFAGGTKGTTGVQQKVGLVALCRLSFLCLVMMNIPDLKYVSNIRVARTNVER